MTPADVDTVLDIEQAVQAYPWTRGNFVDALASGYVCRVLEQDGAICGFAILLPLPDEAELLTIGVAAAGQGKGLGRALLQDMFDLAHNGRLQRVLLEVRASNAAALALYRSAGFAEIGVRRGYYRNGNLSEDAIMMACDLTGTGNG